MSSLVNSGASLFRLTPCAKLVSLSILIYSAALGQAQNLSITNYQLVNSQNVNGALSLTYTADLVNTGTGLAAVTAVATSLSTLLAFPAGQNTLQFGPVPANSQVTSSNTFTILVTTTRSNGSGYVSQLQWAFETGGILLPSNISLTPSETVSFPITLGTPAPSDGALISLTSSNPAVASVSPAQFFVPAGLTSPPRSAPFLTANSAGSVTITASGAGYITANTQVLVTSGTSTAMTMSFWPGSLTISGTGTQNLTLNLSSPAPSTLVVNLASSNGSVATTLSSVTFAQNATSVTVPVTGVTAGSATITASASNLANATASVTVTPTATPNGIVLPSTLTVASGTTVNLPVSLGAASSTDTVSITLTSSNPSIAGLFPQTVTIPEGITNPRQIPAVTGNNPGTATITASAAGYTTVSTQVQVTGSSTLSMSFSPANLTINGAMAQSLSLTLSSAAPAGQAVIVSLSSSNPAVATVPAVMTFGSGTTLTVPVTGVAPGSATISATAVGVNSATAIVTVTQPAAGGIVIPPSVTLTAGGSANFPVALGTAASAGNVTVALASSNSSVATVFPSSVTIPAGTTSASTLPSISGVSAGSASITASAFGYPTVSSQVTVMSASSEPTMSFSPNSLTIVGSGTQNLTLNLSVAATDGLTVTLGSSNTGVATVPSIVRIPMGSSSASVPVTALAAGSTTITASAPGFAGTNASVTVTSQVTSGGGTSYFTPPYPIALNVGTTYDLTVVLSPVPTSNVTINLVSSNTGVATVPSTVTYTAGSGGAVVPVTGVAAGSVTITALTPNYGSATSNGVTVNSVSGVSVSWYGACWYNGTINGFTGNYQAVSFSLQASSPVVFNGSLFFTPNCDPSQGIDNLNDTGYTVGSGNQIEGFTHHPNTIPSSAVYWIGTATTTGMCPPGSPCSGCVTYTASTPTCNNIPE